MTDPEPSHRREPLLVRMAKILGLAIAVLIAGMLFELMAGSALPFESFRSGMGYAYLAGVSMLIAFGARAETLQAAATRAAGVSAVGLAVWLLVGAGVGAFDVVSGLTGIWYTTFVRLL